MWGVGFRRLAVLAAVAIALGLAQAGGQAHAQALPSRQELNPVERAPPPKAPAGNGDLLSPPEPGPCPLANSDVTLTLNAVSFKGAETVSDQALAPAFQGYLGHEAPVKALCEIRDRASVILFHEGILARVEIPAQKIENGNVRFEVIEAFIATIRVRGDAGPGQSKVEDYIEALRGMRPFNLNTAQRYLFLASDIPGVHISATLKPAGRGRGAIELDVDVSRVPFDILANVENFGASETGPFGGLLRVDLNSFTALGERSTFVYYNTFDLKEQRVIQVVEEARIGDDGLLGRLSFVAGETHPGDMLKPLGLVGQSYVAQADLDYPILRTRDENVSVSGGFDYVEQKENVMPAVPLTRDKLRVFYLRTDADTQWRDFVVPVTAGGDLEFRQGVDIFGATKKGSPNLSRIEGRPDAFVMRGEAHASAIAFPGVVGNLRVGAQYAQVPLLSYEDFAVGNLTIGRGYDPDALSGDKGIGGSAEIHWTPFPRLWLVSVSGLGFFDIARVWNLSTGGENRSVRSAGAGLSFDIASRMRVDVTYAHPMDKVSSVAARPPGSRILVNITAGY
jgi:hemolysin activation/secretion protein